MIEKLQPLYNQSVTETKGIKQDGPSLESSSYLNVTLRYLGPFSPTSPPDTSSYGMVWYGGLSEDQ